MVSGVNINEVLAQGVLKSMIKNWKEGESMPGLKKTFGRRI